MKANPSLSVLPSRLTSSSIETWQTLSLLLVVDEGRGGEVRNHQSEVACPQGGAAFLKNWIGKFTIPSAIPPKFSSFSGPGPPVRVPLSQQRDRGQVVLKSVRSGFEYGHDFHYLISSVILGKFLKR